MGPVVVSAVSLTTQSLSLYSSAFNSIILLSTFEVALVFFLSMLAKDSPAHRHEIRLKDYVEARQIIRDKAKG